MFLRVIETKLSKDTSSISKSKMAAGGHLGFWGVDITFTPFITERNVIPLFYLF